MASDLDFEAWYRANSARLVATLGAVLSSDDAARDAVAEACARAYARWGRVGKYANPTGWVYVVALREARRCKARRDREVEPKESAAHEVPLLLESAVWQAVQELPERARLAIALRYFGDLPEDEVARIMSISRGGASALLHKARSALRTRLSQEEVSNSARGRRS